MAIKGYVSVPKDQAAAKQQQLAALAAQNAEHETVSGLPPLRPSTPPKSLAVKKQKSKRPRQCPRQTDSAGDAGARAHHDYAAEAVAGVVSG